MVYLGTEAGSKAFRLFDPAKKRLIVSRDVKAIEEVGYDWSGVNHQMGIGEGIEWINFVIHNEEAESEMGINDLPNNENDQQNGDSSDESVQGEDSGPSMNNDQDTGNHRSERNRRNPAWHNDYVMDESECLVIEDEPTSFEEAERCDQWKKAMDVEIQSIEKNDTWTLCDLPVDGNVIGLKWVYKLKRDAEGKVTRYKERLVAKGYVQQYGIDFEDVFAPVARIETIRLILALAAQYGWLVCHMDVKSAFLNGELKESVYVKQPEGYEVKGKEDMVYKLRKALYGLKQAPRAWNERLDKTLKGLNFEKCPREPAVYRKGSGSKVIVVGVYVDDLIITGASGEEIDKFKKDMKDNFDMEDLGKLSYYLGLEVKQYVGKIVISQQAYAKKVLRMAGLHDCNSAKVPMEARLVIDKDEKGEDTDPTTYRKLIGCLRYLTHTRPDLNFSVGVLSRYMQNSKKSHLLYMKHILRYVKGTIDFGLVYTNAKDARLIGYCDSNHATDFVDGKSTTGMIFYFGASVISWNSQKQKVVALSSCESEFMAAAASSCQALWLRGLLAEILGEEERVVTLKVDNKSAIMLIKNPVFHGRSKHINTRYHFIRNCVEKGEVAVEYVEGKAQKADILTKALSRVKFEEMRKLVGVMNLTENKD